MIDPYRKRALARLKKARGQVNGIIKMVEEGKYCTDIITQTLALQGAIRGVAHLALESHLKTCGPEHLASKNSVKREKFIREIMKACELSSR